MYSTSYIDVGADLPAGQRDKLHRRVTGMTTMFATAPTASSAVTLALDGDEAAFRWIVETHISGERCGTGVERRATLR